MIFEYQVNSELPFSKTSYSQGEKDKSFNIQLMLLITVSKLYYKNSLEQFFERSYVSDSSLIEIYEDLYDYYKDKGYIDNNDDSRY